MEIEIYSDVVCPWCYLGTARLMSALSSYEGDAVLRWRAFQLDPAAPRPGRPLLPWLASRFGGESRARQAIAHVSELAEADGLRLDFEHALIANTFDAHRLLWFADRPEAVAFGATADTQQDLAVALHRAHFTEGLDISSHEVLIDIAAEHGLQADRIERLLATTEGTAEVRGQLARANDLGITSVPTFILAGRYAVTGAQETATLRSVLDEVARREGQAATFGAMVPSQRTATARDDDTRVS
ncbi:MAG TPA: DsbA family oxidoreductase [Micromonosporaceae bacterium]|nr:DsbA family oxidoreductase [Micromonosporaceae bacterium]